MQVNLRQAIISNTKSYNMIFIVEWDTELKFLNKKDFYSINYYTSYAYGIK